MAEEPPAQWEGVLSQDGQSSGGLVRKTTAQAGGGSLVSAIRQFYKLER